EPIRAPDAGGMAIDADMVVGLLALRLHRRERLGCPGAAGQAEQRPQRHEGFHVCDPPLARALPRSPAGQMPCFPGARIPFGSSASLMRSLSRRKAWSLKAYIAAMSSMKEICAR